MSWYRDIYLKSEDWHNLRAAMLARYAPDGICPSCKQKSALDVHHVRYRKIWDVHTDDLMVLCRDCHSALHEIYKKKPTIKKAGPAKQMKRIATERLFKNGKFYSSLRDQIADMLKNYNWALGMSLKMSRSLEARGKLCPFLKEVCSVAKVGP